VLNHTLVLVGKGRAASEIKRPVKQGLMFSPRDRELSAKRHAIKKLENSLTETKRELSDLKKENRLLNRLQVRQEKEINRFQTQEGELPEILSRHAEEVRVVRNRNCINIYIHTHTHTHRYMYLLLYCMILCVRN
jgi:Skp family chaperone for outer membrane proteins